jgi:NADPH:quinone reductase-like Zn-dependent oxidoreductase
LRGLGAELVIEDGPDLAERAGAAAGGAPIRLGIDAISGDATRRIMQCVADAGVTVNYGGLSGDDPGIDRPSLGVRGVSLMGFMLGRGLAKRSPEAVRALYADLGKQLSDKRLQAPIDTTYPIEEIKQALAHAQKAGRNGKILVLPHGRL